MPESKPTCLPNSNQSQQIGTVWRKSSLSSAFIAKLSALVASERLLLDPADCWVYGYDNSQRHHLPDAVVFPINHAEVVSIVQACVTYQIPLVARGRGTGTPGGAVPVCGGVVISFERMRAIKKIDAKNRVMVVEPGVTNGEIQAAAAKIGFFWPPDPTSAAFCSVGGNLAYNSAGPRAIKYGTPRENTLGLKAVTGQGHSITTGVYTTKGVVGYDLTRLLIGSEGTLALITEATLKLTPLPEAKQTFRAFYDSVEMAASAVSALMAQPVVPAVLEFMDANALALLRTHSDLALPASAQALLLIETDGLASTLIEAAQHIRIASTNAGLLQIDAATQQADIDQLWQARKSLSPILKHVAAHKINEDVVVPVAALPQLIQGLNQLAQAYNIQIVNFGHAGNGNIHVNLLVDTAQLPAAQQCLQKVFALVLQLQGTLSGEHGIGFEKREFLSLELEPAVLDLMRQIKHIFDPSGILNPEKIFPST